MIYNTWDIILVPFPFTDKNTTKKRPALVINNLEYQAKTGHLILLMITSAKNSSWYSDTKIEELDITGLKAPSIIRFKVFSLDEKLIIKKVGVLSEIDKQNIKEKMALTINVF
jgi:mRNA interferase MazF